MGDVEGQPGRRGRLTVYLGAAPGVGKTYAMLGEARRRAERGTDVVVGYVETHGRPATAEMVGGLEVVPRREVHHRGAVLPEMDTEAVIARRPAVVLVDELAHTNVLDPSLVPSSSTPSPRGMSLRQLEGLLGIAFDTGKVSVLGVAGLNPGGGQRGKRSVQSTESLLVSAIPRWGAAEAGEA